MRTDAARFAEYSNVSDEKRVIIDYLKKLIAERQPKVVLDIGAGSGVIPAALVPLVDTYTALEPKTEYAPALAETGAQVITDVFPSGKVSGHFDLIILSHVLYYAQDLKKFLDDVYSLLAPGGAMVVVSNKGDADPLKQPFDEEIGDARLTYSIIPHSKLLAAVSSFERTQTATLTSYITERTIDEIVGLDLPIVLSDAAKEEKAAAFREHHDEIVRILDRDYRQGTTYRIPVEHFVAIIEKPA